MKIHMHTRPDDSRCSPFPAYAFKVEHIQGRDDFIFAVAYWVCNLGDEMPTSRKSIITAVRSYLQTYGDVEVDLDYDENDGKLDEISRLVDKFFPELKP